MSQTPEIPSADGAMREIAALTDDYSRRARDIHSNGSRTEDFVDAAKEYSVNEDKLHGDRLPAAAISREQPVHVLMCYMLASGKTTKEIAAATGYSDGGVKLICKQPWFRKRYLRVTAEAGKNEVEAFLSMETVNSLETLVQIRDNDAEKGATRVTAANSILNRALGMPTQHIKSETNLNVNKATEQGDELDRQIAAADAELKAHGVPGNS